MGQDLSVIAIIIYEGREGRKEGGEYGNKKRREGGTGFK